MHSYSLLNEMEKRKHNHLSLRKRHTHHHRKATSVIIHVKVRPLQNDSQSRSTHTVASKTQTISPTTSNLTSTLWANSRDYRIKHENNPNRRKHKKVKQKCKIAIFIGIIIMVITLLTILLCLLLTSTSKKNDDVTLRWNTTGITVAGKAGTPGNQSDQLYAPWGLALTYENTLYVVDRYNNRVQKYLRGSLNGTTVAGQANTTTCASYQCLFYPISIALDNNENLFISEEKNHRVVQWKKEATIGELAAGTGFGAGDSQFCYPYGMVRDHQSGTIYVADSQNHRVMRYAQGNNTGVLVAGGNGQGNDTNKLNGPVAIYFDSFSNSVIISNWGSHNVVRWRIGDNNWTLMTGNLNASSGNSPSSLYYPYGLVLDPMGNLYVADTSNRRVQFFSTQQTEGRTIAGITSVTGSNATLLKIPMSVAVDNQLNLYVADHESSCVQKFMRY